MRGTKAFLYTLFAVLALGAAAMASTASAAEELFLTQSGKELLVLGLSERFTLRALNLGILGTITCEHDLLHGWALHKSPLIHRLLITLHGKCEQTIGAEKTTCVEPITFKLLLGELGLLLLPGGKKDVVLLVAPSAGAPAFFTLACGSNSTSLEGAVIGEFPEVNAKGVTQYNKQLTEYELRFESEKANENQRYTKLDLLGVEHPGILKISGFFGGAASLETTEILHSPTGWIEICIHP